VNLFESIRLEIESERVIVYDLPEHLERLRSSALEFGFKHDFSKLDILGRIKEFFVDRELVESNLIPINGTNQKIFKLKIIVGQTHLETEFQVYTRALNRNFIVKLLAAEEFNINSQDSRYRHKILPRIDLTQKFLRYSCDELIWTNEHKQICEGSFTNIFVQDTDDHWYTPALSSNILAGVMRRKIIGKLSAQETLLYEKDLRNSKKIILTNALIGMVEASLLD
jgi:branched-subunit amino acid aminotransferase/4-amino-4-deoxychorismate lyase